MLDRLRRRWLRLDDQVLPRWREGDGEKDYGSASVFFIREVEEGVELSSP